MSNIYTKKGDSGETSLLSGERIWKSDLRVETYGVFDEMTSILGLARVNAVCSPDTILWMQERNFALCAELAGGDVQRLRQPIIMTDVKTMEDKIDQIERMISRGPGFTIPASNQASGFLHQARTVARRGERRLAALDAQKPVRTEIKAYVNRLSDLLYMLAREEEFIQDLYERVKTAVEDIEKDEDVKENGNKLYEVAGPLLAAGMRKAQEIGVPMVLAVVDTGGNLVAYRRMSGSLLASVELSQGKAFTAVALKMPTMEVGKAVQPGQPLFGLDCGDLGHITAFGGGYPLYYGGKIIGGFGMSGGTVEDDMKCAEYAVKSLNLN